MKPYSFFLLLITFLQTTTALANNECKSGPSWYKHVCHRLHQIWDDGQTELYVSGYAWHNRYVYDKFRTDRYNELAWGGGLGKGFFDEDGDWHGLFAIAFLDSHKNVEPTAGYAFLKTWHFNKNSYIGGGFTVLTTARPDIFHNIPIVGALPWVSFGYKKFAISATYIPGSKQTGNVLFALTKWTF